MTIARPKEGPRAPLFYWALGLLLSSQAFGQTVELSELMRCSALDAQADRLACFEAIVAEAQSGNVPEMLTQESPAQIAETDTVPPEVEMAAAQSDPGIADEAARSDDVPDTLTAEPTRAVAETSPSPEVPTETVPVPAASAAAATTSVAATSAPVASTPVDAAPVAAEPEREASVESGPPSPLAEDAFGRDHLEEEASDVRRVLYATVTDVSKSSRGALIFSLDNGQVWRQTEPRFYPYPRGGAFAVEIEEGLLGKYSLQVEGVGRKVTVRRTK